VNKLKAILLNVLDALACRDLPFKKAPSQYNVDTLIKQVKRGDLPASSADGINWVVCRSEGYFSLIQRTKLAWKVFTGKADALTWGQGQ
jgi:hypothetical protein